jgi:hypothetical protein
MIAEPSANAEWLDRTFDQATAAEALGDYPGALQTLSTAMEDLAAQNEHYQYLYEWQARLHSSLGDFQAAEDALQLASQLAEDKGHRPGVFRMTVARAENALAALDLDNAELLLSSLRADHGVLGEVTTARCDEILAWLSELRFVEDPRRNLAILRCETALVLAGVWAERGKYRSALRLIRSRTPDLAAASSIIDVEQVHLLETELMIEAGELVAAEQRLTSLAPPDQELDRVRLALVRTRLALTSGRLGGALDGAPLLEQAPAGAPQLFAATAIARTALLIELNLWRGAEAYARSALETLGTSPLRARLVHQLERARAAAAAHGRSLLSVWEIPVKKRKRHAKSLAFFVDDDPVIDPLSQAAAAAPPEGPAGLIFAEACDAAAEHLRDRWTALANEVLQALADEDVPRAELRHTALTALTAAMESDYVALRVELLAALIACCKGPSAALVAELCDLAGRLHQLGARGAEAQALRFAAWTCASRGEVQGYSELAQRASAVIEGIATELPPHERTLYLLNKWSGREEHVAGMMREQLERHGGPERIPAEEVCRLFRQIEVLTQWPIDHAFDEHGASAIRTAPAEVTAAWVQDRLATPPRGFSLRSPLSLWRLSPRTLVLHYHVLADRTYLFCMSHRRIELRVLAIGRIQLNADLRALTADQGELAALAEHTGIAGALRRFPHARRLVIVPHDAMANVPFAALPVEGKRLCQRVTLSQLDRLSRLRRRRFFHDASPTTAVIGLDDYGGSRFRSLQHAEEEARRVANGHLDAPAQLLTGAAATCDAALAAFGRAQRVHVAAHGSFLTEDPGGSGVMLRDGDAHRLLTFRELRGQDLSRLQLVTLATCRSAASALLPGGARICLPNAFLQAGARGVIASLWTVDDPLSVELMATLYRELRSKPAAAALAATQTHAIDHQLPIQEWAGLTFYGND